MKGGLRSLGRSAFASLDVCENVLLPNATADPGAAHLSEVDAVLVRDPPDHGRVEGRAIAVLRRRLGCGGGGPLAFPLSSAVVLVGVRLARASLGVDLSEERSDRDGVARLDQDALEAAGGRRGDLDVDLVGGDVADGLVGLDPVAGPLAPLDDRPLGDRDAHLGHASPERAASQFQ